MVFLRIIEVEKDPTPELGSFLKEASHASPRTYRRPVRPPRTLDARPVPPRQGRQTLVASSHRYQWHPVDPPHRRSLARSARTLRQLEYCLFPLQTLAQGRHLGSPVLLPVGRTRRAGS